MPRSKSGTVYERRPNVWECRVTVHGQSLCRTVHGTEDAAWDAVRAMEARLGRVPTLGRETTVRALWGAYSASRGQSLAPKTLSVYDWHMRRFWLPLIGDRLAWEVTRSDVQDAMLTQGWTRDRAKRCRRILSAVYSWAVGAGYVAENPAGGPRFELPSDPAALDAMDALDDPFAAIEGEAGVWGAQTVMRCFALVRGLPLEPCWLACVGAGLRVEEALALRKVDVRRVDVGGRMVTQLAVHHARTAVGGRKATKTPRSVRVASVAEPMGARLWELADELPDRDDLLCPMSASNQNKRWRGYFATPEPSKHRPKGDGYAYTGRLASLPYLPMSRMRATHATLMQEAGVPDALNAYAHGHSEAVAYSSYKRPDTTGAAERVGAMLSLVG